tara:strand:+ start:127 stop:399 length:273 start_codon:yes stop_codon:yes gene_type:complete
LQAKRINVCGPRLYYGLAITSGAVMVYKGDYVKIVDKKLGSLFELTGIVIKGPYEASIRTGEILHLVRAVDLFIEGKPYRQIPISCLKRL